MKRTIIILLAIAVVAALAYFGYQSIEQQRAGARSNFQTVEVTRGELIASVGATGTARANQTAVVNWRSTGVVGSVTVQLGEQVEAGQLLALLDERSLPQTVILARADLISAQRELNQLLNSDTARATAQQNLVLAQKELEDALQKRESKDYARASEATVDELRANYILAEDAVSEALEIYDRVDDLPENDPNRAAAFSQLAVARRNRDRALANLNYVLGRPNDLEIAEADAAVMVAEARLKDAQREWDRLKDGPDPDDITAAEARIAALEATLSQVALAAPISGTITAVQTHVGDQANTGSEGFRIDDLSRLLVDVQIAEIDINQIRVGLPANMSFDAILGKEYSGRVVEVARVGDTTQGGVNFNVTIEIDDPTGEVRPGMTAAVNIITDMVQDALLVPNRAVRLREGRRVVWVLRNNQAVMVEVELGRSADTMSEVIGGDLEVGELLILNPPNQLFQPGGGF